MLHGSAVSKTSRTRRPSSPAAKVCGKIPAFEIRGKKTADYCEYHAPDGMVDVKTNYKVVQNPGLLQLAVFRSGRHMNARVLCTARIRRDGQSQ